MHRERKQILIPAQTIRYDTGSMPKADRSPRTALTGAERQQVLEHSPASVSRKARTENRPASWDRALLGKFASGQLASSVKYYSREYNYFR